VSNQRGYLLVLLVVLILSYTLHLVLRTDRGQRNLEIFTEMVYSQAYEPFSADALLPGGSTQQPLVPGVVPRGFRPFAFDGGTEEAQRAGRELASPLADLDPDAIAAVGKSGRELYGIYCSVCHDAGGNGRGKVVEHGMPPPPSLHAVRATQMADGEMFHIVTLGQGNMGPFAAQLSEAQRWQVIQYVRQIQEEARP
jgi:mono/diheme cytochrome c family protein